MGSPTFEANTYSPSGQIVQPQSVGKYKETLKALVGPAAYETGGVLLTAEELELTWINFVYISTALSGDRLAHIIYPDNSGPCKSVKILITDLAGTEIGNGVDLSAFKFRIHAQGEY
jgi:hypothetical protein